ncbi:hypothetical protein [Novosphingobium pentaromativorans]|uniref:Uncharacterized protein n=1 Tax=Novosphingobium pentaromativorans US6-1 TaxID=1088721 RepID=G6E7I0_9SPHN|nr:hypothetical protein [Novosphingobium pentaromativorans]AIT81617.1 hypothetical protein JI59_18530 [Novosphingobium pentaromativorans US6-1]EHJ62803.1 hypothetical protein NSU_0315 [Novosphingobium pentaromativorans US6-1]
MIRITRHAVQRFQERVRPVTEDEARAALSTAAVEKAAEIGAPFVKLGTGQRIVIDHGAVVTVLPKDIWMWTLNRRRRHLCSNGGN